MFAACGDDPAGPYVITASAPPTAEAGAVVPIEVVVTRDGSPTGDGPLTVQARGGRSAEATIVGGRATVDWTVGQLPIANTLELAFADAMTTVTIDVTSAGPLTVAPYAEVDAFLTDNAVTGSTEDLAFSPTGSIIMGVPGHLIEVSETTGNIGLVATTGVALKRPLGLAYDHDDTLWIADGDAHALLALEGSAVREVAKADGAEPFEFPNDVAVGPDGRVYLSDTCTAKVYAIDPATGAVLDRMSFDFVTEGGPNGLVVSADNELWVTTENTVLFCGDSGVDITAPVAGLFRVPLTATGFGQRTTVAAAVGVFGDGLAFDDLGNLYVIFDTAKDFALDETIVYVLPAGTSTLRRAFAATGKVWANVAFRGAELYLSLLAVPPFTTSRGLEKLSLDVLGAELPPQAGEP